MESTHKESTRRKSDRLIVQVSSLIGAKKQEASKKKDTGAAECMRKYRAKLKLKENEDKLAIVKAKVKERNAKYKQTLAGKRKTDVEFDDWQKKKQKTSGREKAVQTNKEQKQDKLWQNDRKKILQAELK